MKVLLGSLAALAALSLHAGHADACTRHTATDWKVPGGAAAANDIILGNAMVGGASRVVLCNVATGTAQFPNRTADNASFISSSLTGDVRMCLEAGNDKFRIVRSQENVVCGGLAMTPLAYGGFKMIISGGTGNDTVIGGDGAEVVDFFSGGGTASATERVSTGAGNDEIWAAAYGTTYAWGGSGNDAYYSWSDSGLATGTFYVQDKSGTDKYQGSYRMIDRFCDAPDVFGGLPIVSGTVTCGNDVGDTQNAQAVNAWCPYNFICATLPTPPAPDV